MKKFIGNVIINLIGGIIGAGIILGFFSILGIIGTALGIY